MKTTILLAAALAGLATVPQTASAAHGEKAMIAIGSFLGGVLIGSHVERQSPPPPVVYCPPPACEPAPRVVIVERPARVVVPAPTGYWKTVQTRVYTPERWTISTDRRGRQTRVCQPGFYTYETRRVWVDTTPVCREEPADRRLSDWHGRADRHDGDRTDRFATNHDGRGRSRF